MSVTPAGILSTPLGNMKDLLARVEAFQTFIGTAETPGTAGAISDAESAIHLVALSESEKESRATRAARRPCAVLTYEPGAQAYRDAEIAWRHDGQIVAILEAVAGAREEADEFVSFANSIGAVLDEMETLAGLGGLFNVIGWNVAAGPARMHPDHVAAGELDLLQIKIMFRWDES